MSRSFITAGPDNGTNYLDTLVKAINDEFTDRGIKPGDLDGMDASFDVAFFDACAKVGAVGDIVGRDTYVVSFGGYPLDELRKQASA